MSVELHLGDCLEILPWMDSKSIEVVITDPPYGLGENNKRNLSRANAAAAVDYGHFKWDDERVDPDTIRELIRVSRNQIIFGGNYYTDILLPTSSWIIWDKMNSGDFADCELAWTSHKRAARKFAYLWNGMIKQRPEKRYHPTQKPLALMVWVLENYTSPGDTILDPFMGSGTTGVACVQTGRRFIGVENDPVYFAIAEKRIAEAQLQPRLFDMERAEQPVQAQLFDGASE